MDRKTQHSKLFGRITSNLIGSGDLHLPRPRQRKRPLKKLTKRQLIQLESEIGRTLFGAVPKGHRREFFNLDAKTWIWHEEWVDAKKRRQTMTTRYELREKDVIKVQPGPRYYRVEGEELRNLRLAAQMYHEKVMRDIYVRHPKTGEKLL